LRTTSLHTAWCDGEGYLFLQGGYAVTAGQLCCAVSDADDADAAVGGQGRQAGLFRCKASAAHIHDTPVDQRGRVVLPPPPPPKHHRRQQ